MLHTRIGIGVIAYNDKQKFVMGKRKTKSCGFGEWAPPGGHLEFGESPEEGAIRELLEETGLQLASPTIIGITSELHNSEKHYISIYVAGQAHGTPKNLEPDKCEGWNWFTWDTLPSPLMLSTKNLIEKHSQKQLIPDNLQKSFSGSHKKSPEASI